MRIKIDSKHARSYVGRDRLIGEVEKLLDSLAGEDARRVSWIDVPLMDETKNGGVVRFTAVVFLPPDFEWMMRPVAEHGFMVVN